MKMMKVYTTAVDCCLSNFIIKGMKSDLVLSKGAKKALRRGERMFSDWSQQALLDEIDLLEKQEDGLKADKAIIDLIKSVGSVYFPRVRDYFLSVTSWHHVNDEPELFYYLNEDLIFNNMLEVEQYHDLITFVSKSITQWNRPYLYRARVYDWHIGNYRDDHTANYGTTCFAILYRGYFYTARSGKYEDRQYCGEAVSNRIKPSNRKEKEVYARIIRCMRKDYKLLI